MGVALEVFKKASLKMYEGSGDRIMKKKTKLIKEL